MMHEKLIKSFHDFHDIVHDHNSQWDKWYYRGESDPSHLLVPKAGRPHFVSKGVSDVDLFRTWCRHSIAYLDKVVENQWDLLAIAQHHGLATRLLDWTSNPMIAAFFAVTLPDNSIEQNTESVIYAHFSPDAFLDTGICHNPFDLEQGIYRVSPRSIAPRIMRQSGIFTLHCPPALELNKQLPTNDKLEKIIIHQAYRKQFSIDLSNYGINKLSMFPDLDGLSRHVNWTYLNMI